MESIFKRKKTDHDDFHESASPFFFKLGINLELGSSVFRTVDILSYEA